MRVASPPRLAILAGFVVAAGAGLAAADGGSGPFAEPTEDRPWPSYGRDRLRSFDAGAPAEASDPSAFERTGNLTGIPNRTFYNHVAVGDLDQDGEQEVVTATSSFCCETMLAAYEANGSLLWKQEGPAAQPLLADFDGDDEPEVFTVWGPRQNRLYEPNGRLRWEVETPRPHENAGNANKALALDVNGDGVQDIVSNAITPFPEPGRVSKAQHGEAEDGLLYGLDGATGERLFSDEVCGDVMTLLVGLTVDSQPWIAGGCTTTDRDLDGGAVEAVKIVEQDNGRLPFVDLSADPRDDGVRGVASDELPYRVEPVWRTPIEDREVRTTFTFAGDVVPGKGLEVVASSYNESGTVFTALDAETGTVRAETVLSNGNGRPLASAAMGDLDGDDYEEPILSPQKPSLVAFDVRGDGFDEKWRVTSPAEGDGGFVGADFSGISLADYDRDGSPEVWTSWQSPDQLDNETQLGGQVRVYDADATLLWNRTITNDPSEDVLSPQPILAHAIADLNDDGSFEQVQPTLTAVNIFDAPRLETATDSGS